MAIPLAFSGFAEEAPPILSGFATEPPLPELDRPPQNNIMRGCGYNVILVISSLEDNRREILNLVCRDFESGGICIIAVPRF